MIRGLENMIFQMKLWEQDFFSPKKRLKTSLITVFRMGGYIPNRARFLQVQSERMRGIQLK